MGRQPTAALILFLNPKKWGSLEEQTFSLTKALRNRGWRSVIFFTEAPTGAIQTELRNCGATVRVLPPLNSPMFYPRLGLALREYHPAVAYFRLCNSFSALPIVAKLCGARTACFVEETYRPSRISRATAAKCYVWDRIVLRGLGVRIVAVSDYVRRVLVQTYKMDPARVRVALHGVNTCRFSPTSPGATAHAREEFGIGENERVVVCAAHLIPEKGVGDLLIAAKQVLQSIPNVTVVVAGDGPLAQELRQLARDSGIAEKVRFVGLRSDVHRLFGMADVVAVPSVWQEPAGLVLLEAMACGRPVVATRVGGIPEYVEDGKAGILVAPHSPDHLAQALLKLLGSPSLATAMGQAARRAAETRFSAERWVNDTLAMYDGVLSQG